MSINRTIVKVEFINSYIEISYIQKNIYLSEDEKPELPTTITFLLVCESDLRQCVMFGILSIKKQLELHSLNISEFINCCDIFTPNDKEELFLKVL
jgi:hypothetical protein